MPPSPAAPEKSYQIPRAKPLVCYVTDRKALGVSEPAAGLRARIAAALNAGADWVQVREKDMPARELLEVVRAVVAITSKGPRAGEARIIVNDRLDVALAAGAAGVHLGGEAMPARDVVRWCRSGNAPARFLIGVSCHSIEQARDAEIAGVSYVFFGPVFDTPSKRSFGPPQGIRSLGEVCRAIGLPVIAIGGINEENGSECIRAGAAGIAAIRLLQEPRDAQSLRNALARVRGGV